MHRTTDFCTTFFPRAWLPSIISPFLASDWVPRGNFVDAPCPFPGIQRSVSKPLSSYSLFLRPLSPPPSRWPFTFKNQTQVHARSRANAPRFLPSCDKAKLLWNANDEIQLSDSMAIHGLENFRTHFSIDVSYYKEGEKKKNKKNARTFEYRSIFRARIGKIGVKVSRLRSNVSIARSQGRKSRCIGYNFSILLKLERRLTIFPASN